MFGQKTLSRQVLKEIADLNARLDEQCAVVNFNSSDAAAAMKDIRDASLDMAGMVLEISRRVKMLSERAGVR